MRSSIDSPPEALDAHTLRLWMGHFACEIKENEEELTELDRVIGDADHGKNMTRGVEAMLRELKAYPRADWAGGLRIVSSALTSSVGGASGPLYGAFFLSGSRHVPDKLRLSLADLVLLMEAGCQGVAELGKAIPGEKTMVDALSAAVLSLQGSRRRRESLGTAVGACARAAREAAQSTIPMLARKGRASYLGERSQGHQDPGATSAQFLLEALEHSLAPASSLTSTPHPSAHL